MRHGTDTDGSSDPGMKTPGTPANALRGTGRRRCLLLLAAAAVAASVTAGASTATVKAAPSVSLGASWASIFRP